MAYLASHRFARMSARKVRLLADAVRGKRVSVALDGLKFLPHRGARLLEAVIKSARANAEEKGCRFPDELLVRGIHVDKGPFIKRVMPRCRGMAHVIKRPMCHINVRLDEPA